MAENKLSNGFNLTPRAISMVLWVIACALPAYETNLGLGGQLSVSGFYCLLFGGLAVLPIPVGIMDANRMFEATGWLANGALFWYYIIANATGRIARDTAFVLLGVGCGLSVTGLFVTDLDIMKIESSSADPGHWHPAIGAYVWFSSFVIPLILIIVDSLKNRTKLDKNFVSSGNKKNDHKITLGTVFLAVVLLSIRPDAKVGVESLLTGT